MRDELLTTASVDRMVDDYLGGRTSIEEVISRIETPRVGFGVGDIILRVILPADVFRRRLERSAWHQTRVLVSGSRDATA